MMAAVSGPHGHARVQRALPTLVAALLSLAATAAAVDQVNVFTLNLAGWVAFAVAVLAGLAATRLWDGDWGAREPAAPGRGWDSDEPLDRSSRSNALAPGHLAVLIAILLVGAWMRFHRLADLPFGLWYDEAINGLDAIAITRGQRLPLFFEQNFGRAPLMLYLDAALIQAAGTGILPLRLAASFVGILGIPAIFQLGRTLFGARVGLAAAFLLAVARWDVIFSRLNFDAIFVPLITGAALTFLVRGLRSGRAWELGVAALWTALGWYAYLPLRAFPLVVLAGVAVALISRRRRALALLIPLALSAVVGIATLAPLGRIALEHPVQFNARLQSASVFTGKSPEATRAAIAGNVERHLLMFHRSGDRNGRHNLPGAPMLDLVTGGLLVVGAGYALRYAYQLPFVLLIVQFLVMLAGGVLSVEFEAPQALRSFGVVPVVVVLAAVPLGAVWDLLAAGRYASAMRAASRTLRARSSWSVQFEQTADRTGRTWVQRVAIPAITWPALVLTALLFALNYRTYFVQQAGDFASWAAHATAETVIGARLAGLPAGQPVITSSVYRDHPTVRYLAPNRPSPQVWDDLGPPLPATAGGAVVFLQPDLGAAFRELQRHYPSGKYQEVRNAPDSPPALYVVELSAADLMSIEGAQVRLFTGDRTEGEPAKTTRAPSVRFDAGSPAEANLELPFTVEWRGTLRAPVYGDYRFASDGGDVEILIDERPAPQPGWPIRLARGNHTFRASRTFTEPGMVQVLWQRPGGQLEPLGTNALYQDPVAANGLLGRYFRSQDWSGEPAIEQIDPVIALYFHLIPLPRPYSVEWTGKLLVPDSGAYRFGTEAISQSQLWIDGRQVVDNPQHNSLREGAVTLDMGLHDLRLRFADRDPYSHVNLYWTRPGRQREIIPSAFFLPPADRYPSFGDLLTRARSIAAFAPPPAPAGALVPSAVRPDFPQGASGVPVAPGAPVGVAPRPKAPPKPATAADVLVPRKELRFVQEYADPSMVDPRAVALGPSGDVYVLDTGGAQLLRFRPDGTLSGRWGRRGTADGEFEEPSGLAVDGGGQVYVLDAISGWIQRFGPDGAFLGRVAGPAAAFYRPRGMSLGPDGRLYVADTGGGRVVALSASGNAERTIGTVGNAVGEILEPVDAIVERTGEVVVFEVGNARVQRFDTANRSIATGPLPGSVAAHGSHAAPLPDGGFLLTDPDRGRLIRYGRDLTPLAGYGQAGSGPGEFRMPIGIHVDRGGAVYVADAGNKRVQKIALAE